MDLSAFFHLGLGVVVLLAVLDLWVGVSNDAVNFLNSAVGARVAGKRTILTVAPIGVVFGALVSSGMMEVARKGVFNPDLFLDASGALRLEAVLVVYLGVMIADVLLLDLFNTIGLPTSTTVSIVSELVGASLAVSLWVQAGSLTAAVEIVNWGPVAAIFSGILISVGVAFVTGAVAMVLLRLLLTHDLERTFPRWGWIWMAASFAAIGNFVVFKGLRGTTFLGPGTQAWLDRNEGLLAVGFAGLGAVVALLFARRAEALLKVLILVGTAGLATAFAGNDLVNFIGPSVAAAQAVLVEGVQLSGKVTTPAWALLVAGLVMVVALWTSGKSKPVTDTEVRLASDAGHQQRFPSTRMSRLLVQGLGGSGQTVGGVAPGWLRRVAARRLSRPAEANHEGSAYDLLRASVNLVVASALISIGTSYKLPLSTTYITFMVAMGAALGDGVWSRGTADARVAGVLTVIGGWVVTSVLAAGGAFVTASVLYGATRLGPGGAVGGLLLVMAGLFASMVRLHRSHRRRTGTNPTVVDELG